MYYVTIDYGYTSQHIDTKSFDWNEAVETFEHLVDMYNPDEYIVIEILSFNDDGEIEVHRRFEGRED